MNILIVTQYFYPESFRINEVAYEFVKQGHNVTVLTGYPNYPQGYFFDEYKDKKIKQENIQGVNVIRANLFQRHNNPISLSLNYLSYAFFAGNKVKKINKNFDVSFVFGTSPVTQAYPAIVLKKRKSVPIVLNCQDLWPESIKAYGIKERSLIFKIIKKMSKYLYSKCDLIVNSSPKFSNYLVRTCGIKQDKMTFIPNFAENFYLDLDNTKSNNNKKHLMFAGNIGKVQGLDTLVDAVSLLDNEIKSKIIIDILGEGSYETELRSKIDKLNLSHLFVFHGKKNFEELKHYYEQCDALILTLAGDSSISDTIPSKLQGYMGAGKPILGAINGASNDIIKASKCGECVDAGDSKSYSLLIKKFVKNPDIFQNYGHNGREYFKKYYTQDIHIKALLNCFENIIYTNKS